MSNLKPKSKRPISPGHRACAGCGELLAARTVTEAMGPDIIVTNATGCLEVTTTPYPESSWGMPWIHSVFENASSVATGIRAALDYQNKNSKQKRNIKVVAQGGDGGTFDIGFGQISGMWERGDDVLYICYDTEVYSNTGVQASSATPWGARTTTTPAGKAINAKNENYIDGIGSHQKKKDMIAIALAHGLNYVAQTTAGFPTDIMQKVKKALTIPGPGYIQIASPCVPGWNTDPSETVKIGKLAAQTGLYPVVEFINGKLASSMKVPQPKIKVEEYLKLQGRFSHLFKSENGKKEIAKIQQFADENIEKYGLSDTKQNIIVPIVNKEFKNKKLN